MGYRMRWSLPYAERCLCTWVVVLGDGKQSCTPAIAETDKHPIWWFTDEPGPLTLKDNWTPAKLDLLLERAEFCGKYVPQDETWTDFDGPSWIQYDLFRKYTNRGPKT